MALALPKRPHASRSIRQSLPSSGQNESLDEVEGQPAALVSENGIEAASGASPQISTSRPIERGVLCFFVYLQLLDFLTTIVGFRMGAAEASPFIRLLMHAGPTFGVAVSKALALALAGVCIYGKKAHLVRWATYWYSGLIVWNLIIILAAR